MEAFSPSPLPSKEVTLRFLSDRAGVSAVEYIVVGAISLILIGAAMWGLAGAIAGRLNAFNGSL